MVQAEIQILHWCQVNAAGIEFFEELCCQKKQIDAHGIGNKFCNLEDCFVINLNF